MAEKGLVMRVIRSALPSQGMTQDQERARALWNGRKRDGEWMHSEGKIERA